VAFLGVFLAAIPHLDSKQSTVPAHRLVSL
jgi:hypothetical protein